MIRPTLARVDLKALANNYRRITEYVAREKPEHPPRPIGVVKG